MGHQKFDPDDSIDADAYDVRDGGNHNIVFCPQSGTEYLRDGKDPVEGGNISGHGDSNPDHIRIFGEDHQKVRGIYKDKATEKEGGYDFHCQHLPGGFFDTVPLSSSVILSYKCGNGYGEGLIDHPP